MLIVDKFEEAALLQINGFAPDDVYYDSTRERVVFSYANDLEADRLIVDHRDGRALVNSAQFVESMRWARSRVHSVRAVSPAAQREGMRGRDDSDNREIR